MTTTKTLIVLAIATFLYQSEVYSQLNEKFYEVNENGTYQFQYWEAGDGPKSADHPVTERTFFLETKRTGLLSNELSYNNFKEMSVAEKQLAMFYAQEDIIAKMNESGSSSDDMPDYVKVNQNEEQIPNLKSNAATSLESRYDYLPTLKNDDPAPTKATIDEENEEPIGNMPWVLQSILAPGNEKIPAGTHINRNENETANDSDELPWGVQLITKHTLSQSNQKNMAESATASAKNNGKSNNAKQDQFYGEVTADDGTIYPFILSGNYTDQASLVTQKRKQSSIEVTAASPNETSSVLEGQVEDYQDKRLLVMSLMQELMKQDGLSRHIFPGIDGKLYGTSEVEIDEIIISLLNMKDEVIIDADDNVSLMFDELETLAGNW